MVTIYLAQLTAITQQNQTITSGTAQVDFTCVMSGYLLPDEALEWIGNTGLILERSEKHTITYRNGTQATAQNGEERRSLSRISTLTVHQPTIHDNGEYMCSVIGAYQSISLSMNLQVSDTNIKPPQNISSKFITVMCWLDNNTSMWNEAIKKLCTFSTIAFVLYMHDVMDAFFNVMCIYKTFSSFMQIHTL